MKGLKIIPVFAVLLACTYLGTVFVERNRMPVSIAFSNGVQTPETALGLVVLTAVLIGMLIAGAFCSVELMVLVMENRRLKKNGASLATPAGKDRRAAPRPEPVEALASEEENEDTRVTERTGAGPTPNRFTPL